MLKVGGVPFGNRVALRGFSHFSEGLQGGHLRVWVNLKGDSRDKFRGANPYLGEAG